MFIILNIALSYLLSFTSYLFKSKKVFLCVQRCHTARACCRNSLAVARVGSITGYKHPCYIGELSARYILNIAHLISVDIRFKHIGIRFVTDSYKETCDSYFAYLPCLVVAHFNAGNYLSVT